MWHKLNLPQLYGKEMTIEQHNALCKLMDIGYALGVIITHHKAAAQKLELPEAAIEKLREARQAIFAAQRLIEP